MSKFITRSTYQIHSLDTTTFYDEKHKQIFPAYDFDKKWETPIRQDKSILQTKHWLEFQANHASKPNPNSNTSRTKQIIVV